MEYYFKGIAILGIFAVGVFFLAGRFAHWAGMTLFGIEDNINAFRARHYKLTEGKFPAGYPWPRLVTKLEEHEGATSWWRGCLFFFGNVAFGVAAFYNMESWNFLGLLLGGLFIAEMWLIKEYLAHLEQVFCQDMETCAREYYSASYRISGRLERGNIPLGNTSQGRVVRLIFWYGTFAFCKYETDVWVPSEKDHYLTLGFRTPVDVFGAQEVSVFLNPCKEGDGAPAGIVHCLRAIFVDEAPSNMPRDFWALSQVAQPRYMGVSLPSTRGKEPTGKEELVGVS